MAKFYSCRPEDLFLLPMNLIALANLSAFWATFLTSFCGTHLLVFDLWTGCPCSHFIFSTNVYLHKKGWACMGWLPAIVNPTHICKWLRYALFGFAWLVLGCLRQIFICMCWILTSCCWRYVNSTLQKRGSLFIVWTKEQTLENDISEVLSSSIKVDRKPGNLASKVCQCINERAGSWHPPITSVEKSYTLAR